MIQAYYTGINGVMTSSSGIDVVSDNLANVNTTGFRGSNYEFASIFNNALSTSGEGSTSDSVGVGSRLQATPMMENSASYSITDRNTDLAIMGDGWFGIKNHDDISYTRDGAFGFDSDSYLVSNEGEYVLGTMGDNISDANILTKKVDNVPLSNVKQQTKLRFPKSLSYPSEPTTKANFSGNIGPISAGEVRVMSTEVVDGNDTTNRLLLEFQPTTTQPKSGSTWNIKATTSSKDGKSVYDTKTGVVTFDSTGALVSNTLTTIDNNATPVAINLGKNYDGIVSLDNTEISSSTSADGNVSGDLSGYNLNEDGQIIASFNNGKQSSVGQIAIYHFQNDQGLNRLSGTQFSASSNSGKAIFYKDAENNNIIGTRLTTHQLEDSNVDITSGLTDLIILQRSYEANAKSITTADEMIQKALNMRA